MADAPSLDLVELSQHKRVIVCCGSGGVGKTTTAAALGYLAATHGRKVLVMTIDPARRLAQALGLDALGHEPQPIQIGAVSRSAFICRPIDSMRSAGGLMSLISMRVHFTPQGEVASSTTRSSL